MMSMLQVLGLLITYFLLVVQFANPAAELTSTVATNSTAASSWKKAYKADNSLDASANVASYK